MKRPPFPVLLFPRAEIPRTFVSRDNRGHAIHANAIDHRARARRQESQINPSYKNVNRLDVTSLIFQENLRHNKQLPLIAKYRRFHPSSFPNRELIYFTTLCTYELYKIKMVLLLPRQTDYDLLKSLPLIPSFDSVLS